MSFKLADCNFLPGTFNNLDHHQIAALASCFIPGDRSSEQIHLRAELNKPLQQLQDSARRIAEVVSMLGVSIYGQTLNGVLL